MKTTRYHFLLQQYKNNVYSYAMYMLRNKMDAEDAAQEVMIRIWDNIDKFNILSAKAWIMRTTHNHCVDILRKRKATTYKEYGIDESFEENFEDKSERNDPLLNTHNKMMTSKVKEIIEQLPENLKSVFVLYEIEGLKYKEISKTLDLPINTVKVYLLRARKKLQKELRSYETQEII
ncbi:MAG: sigma-70 family RNA polymerase sigma factor [Bacteroidetes bacterium]|nr:sigma-70 family RNA polymerase sigma factor [Bacteroidota bacterium]